MSFPFPNGGPATAGALDPVRYREVFDRVQDIIYVRDMEGVILDLNEAGARFFGMARGEVIGRTLHRSLDDDQAQSLKATNQLLLDRGVDRSTVELRNASGESCILETTTTLIRDDAGLAIGAYGVMRDVTDSVELHRSLMAANEELLRLTGTLARQKEKTEHALIEAQWQREVAEQARALLAADNARKTEELEEARQVQLAMLPRSMPQLAHLEIAVKMRNASVVGGDYYDFHVAEDGTLTVAFGDASGHGMKAGIFCATAKSYFQTLAGELPPRELLETISAAFRKLGIPSLYMCMMLLRIHDRQASIVGAGMPALFVRHRDGGLVERVEIPGMPLSVARKPVFGGRVIDFAPGTSLLLFSDGLSELFNPAGEELGEARIEACFRGQEDAPAGVVLANLFALANSWAGDQPPADDLTMMVVRAV